MNDPKPPRPLGTIPGIRAAALLTVLAALMAQAQASAQELTAGRPLHFVPIAEGAVRIDGSLRDFSGVEMARVGSDPSSSMRYALGYDANGLYIAARVGDDRLVRRRAGGRTDDAVVITLASPTDRGTVTSEIWLHPGVPGQLAGLVLAAAQGGRARPVRGARLVESDREGGYDFEAYVPFSAIPGAVDWQRGRGAIRFSDVDRETGRATPTVHASADAADPERMPFIAGTGAELGNLSAFLRERRVERGSVRFDLRGDIADDARAERVVIAGGHVAAMGAGYRGGERYDFASLGELAGAGVIDAELRDLTGDRKADLLVTTETRGPEGLRRVATVYSFARGRIEPTWGAVVGVRNRSGRILGRLEVASGGRGAPRLVVHAGTAEGLDSSNCPLRDRGGEEEPLIAPWGPIASRIYQFDGSTFAKVGETPNRAYEPPAATTVAPVPAAARPSAARPAAPTAPSMQQLVAAVRRERRIPASVEARFERRANLAEDPRAEELLVLGNALVVVGPGFRGGRSYFHFDLPVREAGDVLDVTTSDVTGDGRDEILVRIRQSLGQGFSRDVLLVHRFTRTGFPRALLVEVARTDGTRRIENRVRTIGRGARAMLVIDPGRAIGWDRASWPFAGFADDGVAPLLLPWQDTANRYRLAEGALVPR